MESQLTRVAKVQDNMNICRLIWEFPKAQKLTYGLGPNFYFISKEQVKLGHEINIVARRKKNESFYEEIDGIKIHRVESPYNLTAIRKIRELHKKSGINVIHAHGTCGISYILFRRQLRIPIVAHAHSISLGMKMNAYRLPVKSSLKLFLKSRFREESSIIREKFFWKQADLLIAVSEAQKEELAELYGIKPEKIHVVHNGVDVSIFKPYNDTRALRRELGLEDKRIILFVGHFVLRKGIPYLLKAMPQVLHEVPNAFLLCVGGTPKWLGTRLYWNILRDLIEEQGLGAHVKLIGQTPHHILPHYYSLADVFAFPSLYEAFAKVLLEAMACETPVIASKLGGLPEAVEDNVTGFLVNPKDVSELATRIIQVLQDNALAQRVGKNGRENVVEKFTWQNTAKGLIEVYQKVIDG